MLRQHKICSKSFFFICNLLGLKLSGLGKAKNVYHRKLHFSECTTICVLFLLSHFALDSSHCILAEQLQFYYFCLK